VAAVLYKTSQELRLLVVWVARAEAEQVAPITILDQEMLPVETQLLIQDQVEVALEMRLVILAATAAPASSSSATLALNEAQAAPSHHPVATRFTPSHRPAHSRHKDSI
jgi:hypothetical protein